MSIIIYPNVTIIAILIIFYPPFNYKSNINFTENSFFVKIFLISPVIAWPVEEFFSNFFLKLVNLIINKCIEKGDRLE